MIGAARSAKNHLMWDTRLSSVKIGLIGIRHACYESKLSSIFEPFSKIRDNHRGWLGDALDENVFLVTRYIVDGFCQHVGPAPAQQVKMRSTVGKPNR